MKTATNFKTINRLAVPATIAGIAEPLLSITDTAIVGNIPIDGVESLAAAGIVGSFLSMLIWVLGQTRSAISAIISQYLGAGRIEEVKSLPAQAIFLNIALSLLILLSTVFIVEEIFALFNATGKILEYCISYYSIRVWGFPLTLFVFAVMGIFRGLQNTYYPMLIAITGAVLNIGLDFLLGLWRRRMDARPIPRRRRLCQPCRAGRYGHYGLRSAFYQNGYTPHTTAAHQPRT